MISINRQTEYALFLIAFLHGRKKYTPLSKISRISGLSLSLLSRVASVLSSEGILDSQEGASGGYILNIKPERITMYKIMSLFEPDRRIVSCLDNNERCSRLKNCPLKKFWSNLEGEFENKLKKIKISQVLSRQ
jgi:Rrf2 family protein